ncbi:hypothetical protein K8Z61_07845 [Nocardioides sp. TRM66260-LWL]|uniref:MXAN_6640 family putative metalloprotease n=1 Tax=Nocardioides sp. TRM66260-LWL TaxID=2874478 RepID=UPI001CC4A278|nr:MXAN_6640 family putative metalloprotease [Nocardioides sp. TRM66260-LWL]MBZ5734406.1 hypothetical protein [Nocardioides sp. TRM66260-LWL]
MIETLPRIVGALAALAVPLTLVPVTADAALPTPHTSARAAAALDVVERSAAGTTRGTDLTLALRELAVSRGEMSPADRATADAYLARPTEAAARVGGRGDLSYSVPEARPACNDDICVHYVTSTRDAPSLTDVEDAEGRSGENGIPDFVDATLREMTAIRSQYLDAGYRAPKSDGTRGGDSRFDVYLSDLGGKGVYGYCTSDDPNADPGSSAEVYDVWSYCALDNDFAEFDNTPINSLRVTAAHEYFHAVQFAYDYYEDAWLMEATAAWIEDEVYPDVNDNLQYLAASPLTAPSFSMDQFVDAGSKANWHYGVWIFFRFLSEKYPAAQGGLPTIVRDVWRRVDAAKGGPDDYSWKGVDAVLRARGSSAAKEFAAFVAANRRARSTYAEGAALKYPVAAPAKSFTVRDDRDQAVSTTIDHLAAKTYRFTPQGLPARATLGLEVDMADVARGSRLVITSVDRQGVAKVSQPTLSSRGDYAKEIKLGGLAYVEVSLVNASGRFTCFVNGPFSCQGKAKDDRQKASLLAYAVY